MVQKVSRNLGRGCEPPYSNCTGAIGFRRVGVKGSQEIIRISFCGEVGCPLVCNEALGQQPPITRRFLFVFSFNWANLCYFLCRRQMEFHSLPNPDEFRTKILKSKRSIAILWVNE